MRGLWGKLPSLFLPLSLPLHFCSWAKNLQDPCLIRFMHFSSRCQAHGTNHRSASVKSPGLPRVEWEGLKSLDVYITPRACQQPIFARRGVLQAKDSPLCLLAPEGAHYPIFLASCTALFSTHTGEAFRGYSAL